MQEIIMTTMPKQLAQVSFDTSFIQVTEFFFTRT